VCILLGKHMYNHMYNRECVGARAGVGSRMRRAEVGLPPDDAPAGMEGAPPPPPPPPPPPDLFTSSMSSASNTSKSDARTCITLLLVPNEFDALLCRRAEQNAEGD
jgi:hypothetical protein